MEKLNLYFLRYLAFAGVIFLTSCGDDDDDDDVSTLPVISISSSDFDDTTLTATGVPDDVVTATITVTATNGVNAVRISKDGGVTDPDFPLEIFTKTSGQDGPTSTGALSFTYTLVEDEIGEDVEFAILAVEDTDDARTSTEILIVTTEEPPSPDARVYTAVLLAPPLGDKSADTFFSTNTGEAYSPAEVIATSDPISADIDFGYFEGATSGANLASPLSFDTNSNAGISAQTDSWGTINDITFKSTTLTSILEIVTWADIDAAFDAGTDPADPSNVTGLAVGSVVAFETDADKTGGSKRGVIEVISITPGTGTTGQIELEIVVQEDAN